MALHRYGGGCSVGSVASILCMPFPMLVRLVGAAKRATEPDGKKRGRGARGPDRESIIRQLEAKEAALAAEQGGAPLPA